MGADNAPSVGQRARARMASEGIPAGSDDPSLIALGAPRLGSVDLAHAVDQLRRALDQPGRNPRHHRETMARHRREWPTLWRALDRLLEAADPPTLTRETLEAALPAEYRCPCGGWREAVEVTKLGEAEPQYVPGRCGRCGRGGPGDGR